MRNSPVRGVRNICIWNFCSWYVLPCQSGVHHLCFWILNYCQLNIFVPVKWNKYEIMMNFAYLFNIYDVFLFCHIYMQVIQKIQPHIVFLELCTNRLGILQLDDEQRQRLLEESKNINFQKPQQSVQKVILIISARKQSAFMAGTFIFLSFKV